MSLKKAKHAVEFLTYAVNIINYIDNIIVNDSYNFSQDFFISFVKSGKALDFLNALVVSTLSSSSSVNSANSLSSSAMQAKNIISFNKFCKDKFSFSDDELIDVYYSLLNFLFV
jgi:hypothetical protein